VPERVLVTGAAGFAGHSLVAALVAAGYAVRAHARTGREDTPVIEWRALDLMESLDFAALVDGCDAVIHLAASLSDQSSMDRVNVEATGALVRAAEAAGVRYFGHASSITVYGSPKTRRVTEATPRLDPGQPIETQYYAEPYMRDYARTKVLSEQVIEAANPSMVVDIYRPVVVADAARLLEGRDWGKVRRATTLYRRTQYVWRDDVSAAILHLMRRGRSEARGSGVEAWNLADESAGTFAQHFRRAYRLSGDARWKTGLHLPVLADMGKDFLRHRQFQIRYPLGMLDISTEKLRATGFAPPAGIPRALEVALAEEVSAASA